MNTGPPSGGLGYAPTLAMCTSPRQGISTGAGSDEYDTRTAGRNDRDAEVDNGDCPAVWTVLQLSGQLTQLPFRPRDELYGPG